MAQATSYYSVSVNDNSISPKSGAPETSTTQIAVATLTPASVANAVTLAGNLKTAINGLIIGVFGKDEITYSREVLSNAPANSPLAQRENKWLVRYIDETSNKKYQCSIGTADLTKLGSNSEFLDLAAGPGLAFKTAFEAFAVPPDDPSHAVKVISVQFVGRNT